jgi:hypothetical protein
MFQADRNSRQPAAEFQTRTLVMTDKFVTPKLILTAAVTALGLCLESGGNSLAAFSEHVDLGLIRPRGQV